MRFLKDYSILLLILYSEQFYYSWNFNNSSSTPWLLNDGNVFFLSNEIYSENVLLEVAQTAML